MQFKCRLWVSTCQPIWSRWVRVRNNQTSKYLSPPSSLPQLKPFIYKNLEMRLHFRLQAELSKLEPTESSTGWIKRTWNPPTYSVEAKLILNNILCKTLHSFWISEAIKICNKQTLLTVSGLWSNDELVSNNGFSGWWQIRTLVNVNFVKPPTLSLDYKGRFTHFCQCWWNFKTHHSLPTWKPSKPFQLILCDLFCHKINTLTVVLKSLWILSNDFKCFKLYQYAKKTCQNK